MLEFQKVTRRDIPRLRRYYQSCNYQLCEYSALVKLMWHDHLHPSYAEAAGCLIVRNRIDGRVCFDFPVAGRDGNIEGALSAIEEYCTETGTALTISVVPSGFAPLLMDRYPHFNVTSPRIWSDYIYAAEDLREFAGRRYSGQRNHINKFRKLCPDAAFRVLTREDMPLIEQFWSDYKAGFSKVSELARKELALAKRMLGLTGSSAFFVGGLMHGGRLISLSMAERCGNTLQVHIEKALYSIEGVYPATVQAFAREFAVEGIEWINREDDAADKGLRTSKLQYLPDHMGRKQCFSVKNELESLPEIPEITTERLTLDALREGDAEAYNALCLDDERNKWWGYDYRKDWKGEALSSYFLSVVRHDFAHRTAISFAVRLHGQCIGEAVLYRFDCRGGAELGCRIASEYAGCGYGTEAFAAAADWALYRLHLSHVTAKCYRENAASYRMLSFCMRLIGEDEVFFYFDREV